jgi:UDP-N-acetylglucosamine acyltransferase
VIDALAVVHPDAKLADDVVVGPWTLIGPDVEIGAGTWIGSHVVIKGPTRIGCDNKIFQFSSVGEAPQDKKFRDEPTQLIIGDRNVIRENCTLHRGTIQDNSLTRIGDDNLLMAYVHVAHDCVIGNNVIMANNSSVAGHVRIDDYAILGGFTGVHQFCRIGAHSFTGVGSVVVKDIPPYLMVAGQNAVPHGLNTEGLRRRGFSSETLTQLKRAYKVIYRQSLTVQQALPILQEMAEVCPEVGLFVEFLKLSDRGIVR